MCLLLHWVSRKGIFRDFEEQSVLIILLLMSKTVRVYKLNKLDDKGREGFDSSRKSFSAFAVIFLWF